MPNFRGHVLAQEQSQASTKGKEGGQPDIPLAIATFGVCYHLLVVYLIWLGGWDTLGSTNEEDGEPSAVMRIAYQAEKLAGT